MDFKFILNKTMSSSLIRNSSKMLSGTIIGQILSLILVPIATRIYGAEYYGDLAVFTSTTTVILSFLGFGLSSAIMVADSDDEASGIYKIAVYGTGIFLIIMLSIGLLVEPYFKAFNTGLNYKASIFLLFSAIYMTNMINMSNSWLNRLGKFNVILLNPLITVVINNTILISLGLMGYKGIGLYLGFLLGQFGTLVHMQKHMGKMPYKLNLEKTKNLLKSNSDFILYQYPSGIAQGVASQFPIMILSYFFGNTVVGYYSMSQRLLNIPISLIGGSITRVYFKEAVDRQKKNLSARIFTYKLAKIIMLIYSLPAVLLLTFGDIVVPLVLGSEWKSAGIYLQVMVIWNMFSLLVHCFGGFPSVIGMQKRNMMNSIITLITDFIMLVTASFLFNSPIVTLSSFVFTHVIIHIWFYNDMFSAEIKLKNKYLKLSIIRFFTVLFISFVLRYIFVYSQLLFS